GKTAASVMEMADALTRGAGTVTFWAKRFGSDGEATLELEYNTGDAWVEAGKIEVKSSTYTEYTVNVSVYGSVRLRLRQLSGARVNIDDFSVTPYVSFVNDEIADYHRWDAYCRGGELVVEASETLTVAVYALDGTIIYLGSVEAGETTLNVSAGLYIVAVDDFARRVVVK
ncbi:MAG: hypothetical protein K2M00_02805, partial [Muribaculaceae bacterium]|nr:hypothetical protein [Muribaculaceae bacterium]